MSLLTRPKKTVATIVVSQTGDGDTTDIQTGINMIPAGGGVVYIKEGTYVQTQQIVINKVNINIIGSGFSTVIQNYGFILRSWEGGNHFILENLQLDGNSISNYGVEIVTGASTIIDQIIIKDLNILNFNSHGIYVRAGAMAEDIYDIKIINNKIYSNGGSAIYLNASDMFPIFILQNYIIDSGGYGIFCNSATQNVRISSNTIWNSGEDGIKTDGYGDIISGNYVWHSDKHGLHILSEVSSISENIIIGSGFETADTYSDIYINNQGNTIVGNVFKEVGATTKYNVHLDTSADNNTLIGNNAIGATTNIQDDGDGNQIGHNITI